MSTDSPVKIPKEYARGKNLRRAYCMGWNHGHGIACHNVPTLGANLWCESLGRVTVTAENIREVHESACFEAEQNSRQYSPFEFTASEFNNARNSEALWEAYESGITDSIRADLAEYTDEDYGIVEKE